MSGNILNLQVDNNIAIALFSNLEINTRQKINSMFLNVKNSNEYKKIIDTINDIATKEVDLEFNSLTKGLTDKYTLAYNDIVSFQKQIITKLENLDAFIETQNECIFKQEKKIIDFSNAYSGATTSSPGITKEDCQSKLGSDPFSIKMPSDCPGITKNCYWEEYTKIIQLASLMPIPDDATIGSLSKRLFRYYPVALQIPVPVPPGVLPTLAMGIPDPMISIPMPMIWKLITTINTPIGTLVIWIVMCGPVISPIIMYIDQNMSACFLATGKGPISIPAKSLKITNTSLTPLIHLINNSSMFSVSINNPKFAAMIGMRNTLSTTDVDNKKNVVDKIIHKLKSAVTYLDDSDPWNLTFENSKSVTKLKKDIYAAFHYFPPNSKSINEGLDIIKVYIDKCIDKLNIKDIKYPSDRKKLSADVIGPPEFTETFTRLIESGVDMAELGLGIPMISLHNKIYSTIDTFITKNSKVKKLIFDTDTEIFDFESKFAFQKTVSILNKKKIRAGKLKYFLYKLMGEYTRYVTPEVLGFIKNIELPVSISTNCYDSTFSENSSPYISEFITIIQNLPDVINQISDADFLAQIETKIDLSVTLPSVEDCIHILTGVLLLNIKDIIVPDLSSSIYKQILKSATLDFIKFKVYFGKLGISRVDIKSDLIKSALKTAVEDIFNIVKAQINKGLDDAVLHNDVNELIAVGALIKSVFGADLYTISAQDVKSFLISCIKNIESYLQNIDTIINLVTSTVPSEFKSIKKTLFPSTTDLINEEINPQAVKIEIKTKELIDFVHPVLEQLDKTRIPFPVALLMGSQMPSREIATKINPLYAVQPLPSWEQLSTSNLPFMLWIDQFVATAQKNSGLFSDYVIPYYMPDV